MDPVPSGAIGRGVCGWVGWGVGGPGNRYRRDGVGAGASYNYPVLFKLQLKWLFPQLRGGEITRGLAPGGATWEITRCHRNRLEEGDSYTPSLNQDGADYAKKKMPCGDIESSNCRHIRGWVIFRTWGRYRWLFARRGYPYTRRFCSPSDVPFVASPKCFL